MFYFDYFGYGETLGVPSEKSTNEAMFAMVQEARRLFPANKIISHGRSIGSGPACAMIN